MISSERNFRDRTFDSPRPRLPFSTPRNFVLKPQGWDLEQKCGGAKGFLPVEKIRWGMRVVTEGHAQKTGLMWEKTPLWTRQPWGWISKSAWSFPSRGLSWSFPYSSQWNRVRSLVGWVEINQQITRRKKRRKAGRKWRGEGEGKEDEDKMEQKKMKVKIGKMRKKKDDDEGHEE